MQAVDLILSGSEPGGQVRERAADGSLLKYNYNPHISGAITSTSRGSANLPSSPSPADPSGSAATRGPAPAPAPSSSSSFLRSSAASPPAGLGASGSGATVDEGDAGGVFGAGRDVRRLRSRQAVAGLTAETALLRLFTYELDEVGQGQGPYTIKSPDVLHHALARSLAHSQQGHNAPP